MSPRRHRSITTYGGKQAQGVSRVDRRLVDDLRAGIGTCVSGLATRGPSLELLLRERRRPAFSITDTRVGSSASGHPSNGLTQNPAAHKHPPTAVQADQLRDAQSKLPQRGCPRPRVEFSHADLLIVRPDIPIVNE